MRSVSVITAVFAAYAFFSMGDAWLFGDDDLDCMMTEWTVWSEPDASGQMSRERVILRWPTGSGEPCPNDLVEYKFLDTDCEVSQWSMWSENYDLGLATRLRNITHHPTGAGEKCPNLEEIRIMDTDCEVSQWSMWSENYDLGLATRLRNITHHPTGAGEKCPNLEEIRIMDTDCEVSQWSSWGSNFGFGQQNRLRNITHNPTGAGQICPTLEEVRETGIVPTVTETAVQVANYFVRPNGNTNRVRRQADPATGNVRDLLLMMDSSGSIGRTDFSGAKSQLSRLFGLLCPVQPFDRYGKSADLYNKAAMLTFSTKVYETFDFDDCKTTVAVQDAISTANYYSRGTNTAEAFKRAKQMFENSLGVRSKAKAKHEVLILTDGRSNDRQQTLAAVGSLREIADVYGLMIGTSTKNGMDELTQYVSSPLNQHLFYVESFRELKSLVDFVVDQKEQRGHSWCAPFETN